jgi:hypothetical protein
MGRSAAYGGPAARSIYGAKMMKQEELPVTEKARLERPEVSMLRAVYLSSDKTAADVLVSRKALGVLLATLDDYRTKNDKRRIETKARYQQAMHHLDAARELMRKDWWNP